jgi:hypothetical protein
MDGEIQFPRWRAPIASRLMAQGVSAARAERLAALVIAAIEGSLIQARVEGHAGAIESCARELEALLDAVAKEVRR